MEKVKRIAKLSDHAAVMSRERDAAGCFVIVVEDDGSTSIGWFAASATPHEMQNALCSAICEHALAVGRE